MTIGIFLTVLFAAMSFGAPIAFALMLTVVALMWHLDFFDAQLLAQNVLAGIDSFPLLAVPFFVLAGELMNAGGLSRRTGHGRERRQVDELLPQRHACIGHGFGLDVGLTHEVGDGLYPRGRLIAGAADLPEDDAPVGPRLLDQPRRLESGRDVGGTGQHAMLSDDGTDLGRTGDAILQRQHERVRPDERTQQGQRGGVVVGLDRVQDDVDGADVGRIFRGQHVCDEVAERAPDPQPTGLNGPQVRATRDDGHTETRVRQSRPVIPPDGARTHHGELHLRHRNGILDRTSPVGRRRSGALEHSGALVFVDRPGRRS